MATLAQNLKESAQRRRDREEAQREEAQAESTKRAIAMLLSAVTRMFGEGITINLLPETEWVSYNQPACRVAEIPRATFTANFYSALYMSPDIDAGEWFHENAPKSGIVRSVEDVGDILLQWDTAEWDTTKYTKDVYNGTETPSEARVRVISMQELNKDTSAYRILHTHVVENGIGDIVDVLFVVDEYPYYE